MAESPDITIEPALSDELAKLGPPPESEPAKDEAPAPAPKGRRSRSGTSGAERARRAKAAPSDAAPKPARSRGPARPNIAAGMASLYTALGAGVAIIPSGPAKFATVEGQTVTQSVGLALVANSKPIGAAWEQAAKDDPRIREALEKLLTVSTFGALIAAHVPVVLAGMLAGGVMPAGLAAMLGTEDAA